ncbi:MAG TPA: prepilin-type N-terminal cleavage/methylation domain-containing protein [Lacunisphaera sp.]
MTISTPLTSRQRGFTLVEVLVATALSAFVLAGVLSALIFLSRSGFRASGYSELESEVRRGLDAFARDTRNATDVHWNNNQSITLTVAGAPVTYAYDNDPASATHRTFYRVNGDAALPQVRLVLIHGVAPTFSFQRFKIAQPGVEDNRASNDRETKQLQLTLRADRTNLSTVAAGNSAISARYMLRNKRVTN